MSLTYCDGAAASTASASDPGPASSAMTYDRGGWRLGAVWYCAPPSARPYLYGCLWVCLDCLSGGVQIAHRRSSPRNKTTKGPRARRMAETVP